MANNLALGLDLGTSALKAIVIDADCRILAVATRTYPLRRPGPGLAEQDPHDWWRALCGAINDIAAQGTPVECIAAIGLSGQMHGLVLVDRDGEPLLPCQTWADSRCVDESLAIADVVGPERIRLVAGSPSSASATAAKLLWVRNHLPKVYANAQYMLLPKDYLRFRLTGTFATDVTDASGTLLCDIGARAWSDELIRAFDLRDGLLPPVHESTEIAGELSQDAATTLGLRAGILVGIGAGDAECAAVGMGLLGGTMDRGLALATLGTAGQFSVATDRPLHDSSGWTQTLCHAVPQRWHVMTAILAGASALSWLASVLLPGQDDARAVSTLLAEAASEPSGARGLLFFPHLHGVRLPQADASTAGAFVGLRPDHTRATLARAVVEGVALALRDGFTAMRDLSLPIERIRLAGAANRSNLWQQVQADVYGVPVEIGASEDASALGAALLAATDVGLVSSLEVATNRSAKPSTTRLPDHHRSQQLADLHSRWRSVDAAIRATQSSH